MTELQKIEFQKSLQKIKDNKQLEYFKNELIKILEASENKISKAIEDYDKSIAKTFKDEFGIEKAGYGIGTVRVWKGQKFRKIAPGKWRRIYDSNTRGASQSIAILTKKIQNAQSIDELLQLVMENTNRFMDADGKLLPIVEKLQSAVKESKTRLNAGKPSTQEQIEQFKDKNKNTRPYSEVSAKDLKVGQKFNSPGGGTYTILAIEKDNAGYHVKIGEHSSVLLKENRMVQVINQDYETEYTKHLDEVKKEAKEIYDSDMEIHQKLEKLSDLKYKEASREREEIEKISDKKNNFKEWKEDRDFITNNYYELIDYLNVFINDVYDKTPEQIEKKRAEKEAKEQKANALKEKIAEINGSIKTYTDAEIEKSFKALESVQKEIDSFRERTQKYKTEARENKKAYEERSSQLKQNGFGRWDKEFTTDPEIQRIEDKDTELWNEHKAILAESEKLEEKLNPLLDAIGYYYLNKFEYEKDSRIDECNTTDEVMSLIKSKDWYSEEGKNNLELNKVDVKGAKDLFKCLERIFAIFPEQKGSNVSLHTEHSNGTMWACASETNGITLNSRVYKNYNELSNAYEESIGFHPVGTNVDSIIYHEYYHVMTTKNDSYAARKIKERVTKKLKMKGKKGGPKQGEVIAKGISEYATKNADEFGAECFCQALGSKNPTQFAIEVFKETLKFKKYMRGLV